MRTLVLRWGYQNRVLALDVDLQIQAHGTRHSIATVFTTIDTSQVQVEQHPKSCMYISRLSVGFDHATIYALYVGRRARLLLINP